MPNLARRVSTSLARLAADTTSGKSRRKVLSARQSRRLTGLGLTKALGLVVRGLGMRNPGHLVPQEGTGN